MTTSNLLANNWNDLVFWDNLKNEFGCSSVCVEYGTLFTVHIHRRSEVGSAVKLGFCQLRSNVQYPFFTLAARGLEERASFPDFCDNRQFHAIYCVYSRFMYFISKNF